MEKKYHYTYLLIGIDHRLYIGVRSCNCLPEEDGYMGSFSDKTFKPRSKHIQEVWSTHEEAYAHEIRLHNEFDVGNSKNKLFANRCRAKAVGFCTLGMVFTAEHRANIGKAQIGRKLTDDHKFKIGQKSKGRRLHKQSREKMGIAKRSTKLFHWINKKLNVEFIGTPHEFYSKYKLNPSPVWAILRGKLGTYSVKGWRLKSSVN